ncbi:phosphoesterase PA-phosphatase [Anaerobacillus arseniciselenatis]|uniref:Phosphoesterase PA-phosphatase n=1 Tax=Anaerobacillus arseniciselenatis TaxID=85682 RepID=A0A1S2LD81_9BACI|nr:phosphatase PAP2 family protein [Anaerobacillus arseniciselenatis]OIJ10220.1 phosphoesterase PA-phosphatase [Anaerobacillus arseniciselenatis]
MSQLEILQWFTQLQHPFLDQFARVFTFLGNEEFYFIILPLIYWCISKPIGFRLFYIFIFSIYINSFLKIYFAVTRPIGAEGVNSLFISSAADAGSHYPHDSFPSGHAQGSATLWGYLAYIFRTSVFIALACSLIFFISISRLYTGLHWPTDIIAGVALGIGIIIIAIYVKNFLSKINVGLQLILAVIVPIILVFLFPEEEGFKFAGLLLGAGVGYILESKFVKMEISASFIRKGIAFMIGLVGMFAIQEGFKFVFPDMFIFDFIRYALIGLWGLFLAPYIFVLFKIYDKEEKGYFPTFTNRM